MMRILVVYYSQFGNTLQVAKTIGENLEPLGETRLAALDQLQTAELTAYDAVIMGVPTHKMNLPEYVRAWFDDAGASSKGSFQFAAFDTSYEMSWFLRPFTASHKIGRYLRHLGGKQLCAPMTFHVEHTHEGPLLEGELQRAASWANELAAIFQAK